MIYLDYAAAVPLSQTTKEYLISLLDIYGNPSSPHSIGREAKRIVTASRQAVAGFIHADPDDIYFTGGGAASNTLGVKGYYENHPCRILYSPISHKSILNCVGRHPDSRPLKVDSGGLIDLAYLKEQLLISDAAPFVVIDYANSELGTIQDVSGIIDLVHTHNGVVYLDCTGSIPTIPLDVSLLDIDICGFSAHKLGGLKGCGVLYKHPRIDLEPLICGVQEQGLVGGTENVLGIASLGKAVEEYEYASVSTACRDYVHNYIINHIPGSYLVGNSANRLPHNLYICFEGVEGEALMMLLDLNGIQVSTGSACNSGSLTASPALTAIGMRPEDLHSCIRMTFGGNETSRELDDICQKLKSCVEHLRNLRSGNNPIR